METIETYMVITLLFGIFLMLCFIGLSMSVALRSRTEALDDLEKQLLDSYGWLIRAALAISLGLGIFLVIWLPLATLARWI